MADRSDKEMAEEQIDTVVDATMANSTGSEGYKGGVAVAPTSAGIRDSQSLNQYPNPGGASAGATTKSGEGISSTDNETDSGVSAASSDYGDPFQKSPYLDPSASGDVSGRLTTPDTKPEVLQPDQMNLAPIGGNASPRGYSGGAGTPPPDQSGGTAGATGGGLVQTGRADRGSIGVTTDGGTTGFGTTDTDTIDGGLATNSTGANDGSQTA